MRSVRDAAHTTSAVPVRLRVTSSLRAILFWRLPHSSCCCCSPAERRLDDLVSRFVALARAIRTAGETERGDATRVVARGGHAMLA